MAVADYDFNQTRNQIIERAYELIGVKTLGETLAGEYSQQGTTALNAMIKSWQGKNIFLWTVRIVNQSLTNGTSVYALTSDPAIVALDATYLINAANDHERLELLSWRQYQDIPDKTSSGKPVSAAIDTQGNLYVWPVPTQSYTLRLFAICKLKDWDSASAGGDFPVRWERALTYCLAADLADGYGLPLGERDRLAAKADRLFLEARQGDRDRSDSSFVEGSYRERRR